MERRIQPVSSQRRSSIQIPRGYGADGWTRAGSDGDVWYPRGCVSAHRRHQYSMRRPVPETSSRSAVRPERVPATQMAGCMRMDVGRVQLLGW